MKRTLYLFLAVVLIVAGAAFAQQHNRTGTPPSGPQSVLSGTVISFSAGAGQGMPTLVVRQAESDVTLVLGPFWFLQNAKFAATAGDAVEVTVMSCADCPNGFAVIAVKNITNGSAVTLRNADGIPLWSNGGPGAGYGSGHGARGPHSGRGYGAGNGPGNGHGAGNCDGTGPDMTQLTTFTGIVKSFAGGAGAGRPTLVLETGGSERTFIVSPFRVVLDSGMQFVAGNTLTITAAPNVNQEWVVVTLKDHATGAELVLRDAQTGFPIGGCGGRHC